MSGVNPVSSKDHEPAKAFSLGLVHFFKLPGYLHRFLAQHITIFMGDWSVEVVRRKTYAFHQALCRRVSKPVTQELGQPSFGDVCRPEKGRPVIVESGLEQVLEPVLTHFFHGAGHPSDERFR